jgi:hypothetical protein
MNHAVLERPIIQGGLRRGKSMRTSRKQQTQIQHELDTEQPDEANHQQELLDHIIEANATVLGDVPNKKVAAVADEEASYFTDSDDDAGTTAESGGERGKVAGRKRVPFSFIQGKRNPVSTSRPATIRHTSGSVESSSNSSSNGGWLFKRARLNTWDERYFCINDEHTGGFLCYFADAGRTNLKGVLDLRQVTEVRLAPARISPPIAGQEIVSIKTHTRQWIFATTKGQGPSWVSRFDKWRKQARVAGKQLQKQASRDRSKSKARDSKFGGHKKPLEGWLHVKLSKGGGGASGGYGGYRTWSRRWCRVEPGKLLCMYTGLDCKELKGGVDLGSAIELLRGDRTRGKSDWQVFRVHTPFRSWLFACLPGLATWWLCRLWEAQMGVQMSDVGIVRPVDPPMTVVRTMTISPLKHEELAQRGGSSALLGGASVRGRGLSIAGDEPVGAAPSP